MVTDNNGVTSSDTVDITVKNIAELPPPVENNATSLSTYENTRFGISMQYPDSDWLKLEFPTSRLNSDTTFVMFYPAQTSPFSVLNIGYTDFNFFLDPLH